MKKSFMNISLLLLAAFSLSSCMTYMASYDVGLSKVGSPANAKVRFGETKVVKFTEEKQNKYKYEDDYIQIVWNVSPTTFYFSLLNKTSHRIKLNWDDMCYVDCSGETSKVINSQVNLKDAKKPQLSSYIPDGAKLSECLMPVNNVYWEKNPHMRGWRLKNLVPSFYKSKSAMMAEAESYVGRKMRIVMPIWIEDVQNDYSFEFVVDKWLDKK